MIPKSDIKKICELQKETAANAGTGVPRELLKNFSVPQRHALILSGIRRCGKSTLLYQLLKGDFKDAFYLNFDDNRLFGFDNYDLFRLDDTIKESGSRTLFFDEIQVVPAWEMYARQKLDENFRVIITGSNASLLSRELGTKLTGRHLDIELFPFSYTEFLYAKKLKPGPLSLKSYLKSGGFPEFVKSGTEQILSDLFTDILIRDIAVRYSIRDIKGLQRLALFLISNCSNKVTGSKLKQAIGISATSTILEYFSHLEYSYLFSFVQRFSYSVRSRLVSPKKIYASDTGLIQVNSASFSEDHGSRLENVIFNFLRSKYKSVYYFYRKNECDFIVIKNGMKPLAIQVCYLLDRENLDRELGGLIEALEFFQVKDGLIITLDQSDHFKSKGFSAKVIPAWEYLSGNEGKLR
jgi:uncharacterized protein